MGHPRGAPRLLLGCYTVSVRGRHEKQIQTWGTRQYSGAIGASGAATLFVHKDHLGSTRVTTTYSTTPSQNAQVSDSMDYMPYGELLSGGGSTTHKFTGKERDAESGLDNFGARYDSSNLGRFMTPDWSAKADPVPY